MTLPARFWMPENPQGKPYVTTGPLAAPPYVECVRADSLDGWRDIESAPKDGTEILAWSGYEVIIVSYRHDENDRDELNGKMWLDNSYDDFSCGLASVPYSPTHWMPLPEPPT